MNLIAAMILADGGDVDHMSGFGWGMMGMGWLFMIAIVGVIVWAVLRDGTGSRRDTFTTTDSAERVLAERFARGEIDADQYRRMSEELRS